MSDAPATVSNNVDNQPIQSLNLEQGKPTPSSEKTGRETNPLPRGAKTICIPFDQEGYSELIEDRKSFQAHVDQEFAKHPEIFPAAMDHGYKLNGFRDPSKKLGIRLRRIYLKETGEVFTICPSFLMPYNTGYTDEVSKAMFLLGFGVPYWALTHIFGRNDMYWYRMSVSFGRCSIVGTTVKDPENLPKDILGDEKHTTHKGEKAYVATTVGDDCVLGAAMCPNAGADALTEGYGTFAGEAKNVDPDYQPESINTDGWEATQIAFKRLFPMAVIIQCILHAFMKIRDCGKKLGPVFHEIISSVWDAYHAENKRSFAQRIRRLREWALVTLKEGVVQKKILALCAKSRLFARAYDHPNAHRTSNMLDRLMRWQDKFLFNRQYFHGSWKSAQLGIRAWAILGNFRPYSPRALSKKGAKGGKCAAERLNGFRYCDNWLENLRVSSSMAGYRQ
jgi:hypothetical protein